MVLRAGAPMTSRREEQPMLRFVRAAWNLHKVLRFRKLVGDLRENGPQSLPFGLPWPLSLIDATFGRLHTAPTPRCHLFNFAC